MTDTPQPDDDEFTDAQKIIRNLNRANMDMIQRIEQMTGGQIDVAPERHETFINYLVDIGVLTIEQMEAFNLNWVDHLNSKLMRMEADLRARIAQQAKEERDAQAARKLGVRPAAAGLIVPGNPRGQNGTGRRRRG